VDENSDIVKRYYAWCTFFYQSIKIEVSQEFYGVSSFS